MLDHHLARALAEARTADSHPEMRINRLQPTPVEEPARPGRAQAPKAIPGRPGWATA